MTQYPEIVKQLQDQIEVLQAKNDNLCTLALETYTKFCTSEYERKKLEEQMAVIEEMGTESLNALPDCLMRLAPALVRIEELESVLEALDAYDRSTFFGPDGEKNRRSSLKGVVRKARKLMKGRKNET